MPSSPNSTSAGILVLPREMFWRIVDHSDVHSSANLTNTCREIRSHLQGYLDEAMIKWHKDAVDLNEPCRHFGSRHLLDRHPKHYPPNIVIHAIENQWSTEEIKHIIKTCVRLNPKMLDGIDAGTNTWPPVFVAAVMKRYDVIALLDDNGADFSIRHYPERYGLWHENLNPELTDIEHCSGTCDHAKVRELPCFIQDNFDINFYERGNYNNWTKSWMQHHRGLIAVQRR